MIHGGIEALVARTNILVNSNRDIDPVFVGKEFVVVGPGYRRGAVVANPNPELIWPVIEQACGKLSPLSGVEGKWLVHRTAGQQGEEVGPGDVDEVRPATLRVIEGLRNEGRLVNAD